MCGAAVALGLLSAVGCQSEASRFVDDYCALLASCCTTGTFDEGNCTGDTKGYLEGPRADPSYGEACMATLRIDKERTCRTKLGASEADDPFTVGPCTKLLGATPLGNGTKKAGEACSGDQCETPPNGWSQCTSRGGPFVCMVQVEVREGEECDLSESSGLLNDQSMTPAMVRVCRAKSGLYCATARRCRPIAPLGGSCEKLLNVKSCEDGAVCKDNQCVPLPRAGEPCTTERRCESGAVCDESTRLCRAARLTEPTYYYCRR